MKNYVIFSEAALESAVAIPWEFPEICCVHKFPEELDKFPEISLIFQGKTISPSFLECVGTLANSLTLAAAIAFMLLMTVVS